MMVRSREVGQDDTGHVPTGSCVISGCVLCVQELELEQLARTSNDLSIYNKLLVWTLRNYSVESSKAVLL